MNQKNVKEQSSSAYKAIITSIGKSPLRIGVVAVAVVMTVGVGTVFAASYSKPGDALYSLRRATQEAQLTLAFTDSMKISAHNAIAQSDLQEIKYLFNDKNANASSIAVALANFEEQKQATLKLSDSTEIKDQLGSYQSQIDALFESQQSIVETQREALKQQAADALKAGDTVLAAQLTAQAGALDLQLSALEAKREASKQEQEKYIEAVKTATESVDTNSNKAKDAPAKAESMKSQQETLKTTVEQEIHTQVEAAKKLQEQKEESGHKTTEVKNAQDNNR